MWNNFQVNVMQNSYVAGQNDTIGQIITKASDKACQPFNIYNQAGKVDLINVACLQKAPQANGTEQATPKK
ncbi:MAG: hypothetical protein PHS92_02725 [Candidatus Gracilibacteria bacterium]|nr:hypothetical protein [Candidatus Gracilibacteria bacterium]